MIPITKPTLPDFTTIEKQIKDMLASEMITNSHYVEEFEVLIQSYLGVKHAITVSSCTAGLMLALKVLNVSGEVIVPSFTFSASGHAILWNNLIPVFVDIDPETYCIDVTKIKDAITNNTSAIMAIHIFGTPANVEQLQEIAKSRGLKLIFDAAHAMGSKVGDKMIGTFGDVEIFSCSPTKILTTGEGGIVTTNNDDIAKKIRIGRNYGDPGNYNCEFPGLSARMSEFNAILGIQSYKKLEHNINRRIELVKIYKMLLGDIPGIRWQKISENNRSIFKDLSLFIGDEFGLDRNTLQEELTKSGIQTKKYFYPPLHQQQAYQDFHVQYSQKLPFTDKIANNILSVPLYSHMSKEEVIKVCAEIRRCYNSYKREDKQ